MRTQITISDIYIICGVTASGKSTVARKLASTLNCTYLEGDDYHPQENIEKMKSGIALNDSDRKGWISAIAKDVYRLKEARYVLSCSALTVFVQQELQKLCKPKIHWVILDISQEIALQRARNREHFMPPELVESQFKAWSPPKNGLHIDATLSTDEIIEIIRQDMDKG